DKRRGTTEEVVLLVESDLPATLDIGAEPRLYLRVEVRLLVRFAAFAYEDNAPPDLPGDVDRQVRSLVGRHSAEPDQVVVLLRPERDVRRVQAVVHHCAPGQVRAQLDLSMGDRHQMHGLTGSSQVLPPRTGRRAMGGDHC